MTIEELEIIVEASIEPALKEIKKLMPQIKQHVTQAVEVAQKSMQSIDMKSVTTKVEKAVQTVKNKIERLKKSSKSNEIAIKVNNEKAYQQITQLEKEIESLQKKITSKEMTLQITNDTLDKMQYNTKNEIRSQNPNLPEKQISNKANLQLATDKNYTLLVNQSDKLNQEVTKYNLLLESAREKLLQINNETSSITTNQNKMIGFFSGFKDKLEQAKTSIKGVKTNFKQIPLITQNITNNINKMGSSIKSGIGHVIKYAGALFSLRSIYNVLRNSANAWLSSQNAGAQQLSANIEYMKYALRKYVCSCNRIYN